MPTTVSDPDAEAAVSALYYGLLSAWNRRSAADYATLFEENTSLGTASVVGFDGSQMDGLAAIEAELQRIFTDHQTGAYVGKIRAVRFLTPGVAILRAVAGLRPAGQPNLNPALNTIQTLVAVKQPPGWRIALFQNTPAQFHGRPDLAQALTEELCALLNQL